MADTPQQWESRIGRRLKLRDLYILSTVADRGSMAKAASHLGISQPAVSESIASLEATLGVRLLERSTRGIEPTRYAHALLKRSHVVFDELRQGIRDIEFLANPAVGEVRVAAGDTLAGGLMSAVIDRFSRRYPQVVVRVTQASTDTLDFREVRERKVDLALARVSRAHAPHDLNVEILFDDPHRVVAGAHSPWARRRKITLAELANEAWIFAPNQVIRELIAEAFAARGLQMPQERVSSTSIVLRNHLLATGRFLTVLPQSLLRYTPPPWSFKALPVDLGVEPRCVAILTLKNRSSSPLVEIFTENVRAVAKTAA